MNIEAMQELQKLSVSKIEARLRDLSDDELGTLLALENQEDAPRATLIAAINKYIEGAVAVAESGDDARSPRASSPEDVLPAWCAADYNGPITGEQMAWRNEHIKPAAKVVTK